MEPFTPADDQLLKHAIARARTWLHPSVPATTRRDILKLLKTASPHTLSSQKEIIEAFGSDLSFGTGGIRALMGLGCTRINETTIAMITTGLCRYLFKRWYQPTDLAKHPHKRITGVIAYDSRLHSQNFAEKASEVLLRHGFNVLFFSHPRPTPQLSYAIRKSQAHFGIVISASHNPSAYNGYKVFNEYGAQVTPPADQEITAAIHSVRSPAFIRKSPQIPLKLNPPEGQKIFLKKSMDDSYIEAITAPLRSPDPQVERRELSKRKKLKILYTPLFGTGIATLPPSLKSLGFSNVALIKEQSSLNGNFPGLSSPNPEDPASLQVGIRALQHSRADLLFATDPDADRLAVVILLPSGEPLPLTGNQVAILFAHAIVKGLQNKIHTKKQKTKETHTPSGYIARTIVTTPLIDLIAHEYQIPCYRTFTGFKHIAALIETIPPQIPFLFGAEESSGYLTALHARDKDASAAALLFAQMMINEAASKHTILDRLHSIYLSKGYIHDLTASLIFPGRSGSDQISTLMDKLRQNSYAFSYQGYPLVLKQDYQRELPSSLSQHSQQKADPFISSFDTLSQDNLDKIYAHAPKIPVGLDVLEFMIKDHIKILIRPSGTEPKIKVYFFIKGTASDLVELTRLQASCHETLEKLSAEFNTLLRSLA